MIEAYVQDGNTGKIVGKFEFLVVPRIGEDVTVPWAADSMGTRIFTVTDVANIAVGVDTRDELFGEGPLIILTGDEIH